MIRFSGLSTLILLVVACSGPPDKAIVYVGTYTGSGSDGIYAYRFDSNRGKTDSIGLVAKTANPSFFTIDPDGRFLYAVNEIDSFQHLSSGSVSVFAINPQSARLDLLQQIPSLGAGPAHISLDRSSRYVLVANYNGGNVAVFPRNLDGTLGSQTAFVQDVGSGPNPDRQTSPHAHFIGATPDNQFVVVADLGIDKVLIFRFDPKTGTLKSSEPASVDLNPGDGPRHIAFTPSGRFMYVINELTSTIALFSVAEKFRQIQPAEKISTLQEGFSGVNTTAEILTDGSGHHLYVSNRGDNSIVVFNISPEGSLGYLQRISTGGKGPRHFEIDPSGRWLLAANQNSNAINLFGIDQGNGRLTPTKVSLHMNSPVCVKFLNLNYK